MSYLVEKEFAFTCDPLTTTGASTSPSLPDSDPSPSNLYSNIYNVSSTFPVFALLDSLTDYIHNLGDQDLKSDNDRVENKLNLIIFLLNNLVGSQKTKPSLQRLRLSAEGLAWQDKRSFHEGQVILIHLYPDEVMNVPLVCQVIVTQKNKSWYHATLNGLSEDEMSAWSKWVFRLHRFQVSQARQYTD